MRSRLYRKARRCVLAPHFVWCELTNCGSLAIKSTVRPLRPFYSSHREHEQDPDTTLVDSSFIRSLVAPDKCPRTLRHVCNTAGDFWKKIEEEQDDSPLDIKHLVLDLQDSDVRLFVSPLSSWPSMRLMVLLHPVFRSSYECAAANGRFP